MTGKHLGDGPINQENSVKIRKSVSAAAAAFALLMGQCAVADTNTARGASVVIDTLPFVLHAQLDRGSAQMDGSTLVLQARHGTDLYTNTDGTQASNTSPRVMFTPVGDFIFSAKVTAAFSQPFDGGALIVVGDDKNWAKLLFERGKAGPPGISSTVVKGVGDDAHHGAREGNSVHLKIARRQQMYVFYASEDGVKWSMIRTFGLPVSGPVQVGLSSQSPRGDTFTARFSDIKFRPATFKDYWQGE